MKAAWPQARRSERSAGEVRDEEEKRDCELDKRELDERELERGEAREKREPLTRERGASRDTQTNERASPDASTRRLEGERERERVGGRPVVTRSEGPDTVSDHSV